MNARVHALPRFAHHFEEETGGAWHDFLNPAKNGVGALFNKVKASVLPVVTAPVDLTAAAVAPPPAPATAEPTAPAPPDPAPSVATEAPVTPAPAPATPDPDPAAVSTSESGPPSEKVDVNAADAAYSPSPPHDIDGWSLGPATPTIKVYTRGQSVLVSVRGTKDFRDAKADLSIPFNGLRNTQRYKADYATVKGLVAQYPGHTFYLTGHSLGSAIGLQLARDFRSTFQNGGEEFNGALEPMDILSQNPGIHETYANKDPLFRSGGLLWRNKRVIDVGNTGALAAHKLSTLKRFKVGGGWQP